MAESRIYRVIFLTLTSSVFLEWSRVPPGLATGLVMTRNGYKTFQSRRKHFVCAIVRKTVLKQDGAFKKKYEVACTCVHYSRHIVLTTRTCYLAVEFNRWFVFYRYFPHRGQSVLSPKYIWKNPHHLREIVQVRYIGYVGIVAYKGQTLIGWNNQTHSFKPEPVPRTRCFVHGMANVNLEPTKNVDDFRYDPYHADLRIYRVPVFVRSFLNSKCFEKEKKYGMSNLRYTRNKLCIRVKPNMVADFCAFDMGAPVTCTDKKNDVVVVGLLMLIFNRPNATKEYKAPTIQDSGNPMRVPSHCLTPLNDGMLTDVFNSPYFYVAEMISSMTMYSHIGLLAKSMSEMFSAQDETLRKELESSKSSAPRVDPGFHKAFFSVPDLPMTGPQATSALYDSKIL